MLRNRRSVTLAIALLAILLVKFDALQGAGFPWVSYDAWVDFEAIGTTVTASGLSASTHATSAGSWDVSGMNGLMSGLSAAEDPAHAITGDTGINGLSYNLSKGGEGYVGWRLPANQNSLSIGLWYKTGAPGPWVEGPHFLTLYNDAFGNMLRLSDERSGSTNARQIRISPLDQAVTGIQDNTWYWCALKWTNGGAGTVNIYDVHLQLVGSISFTDPVGYPAQVIRLGDTGGTSGEPGEAIYFDDLVVSYTSPTFPLIPKSSAPLVSISVAPQNSVVATGANVQFTATGVFADNTAQDVTSSVSWSSANQGVASISRSGLATGGAAGQTTITATSGSIVGSATMSVYVPVLSSIAITPGSATIASGKTAQLRATGTYNDGSTADLTGVVTWSSSSPTVATVQGSGLVTGVAGGNSTISAQLGSVTAQASISVFVPQLTSIVVSPATLSVPIGVTRQLSAVGQYSDGSSAQLTQVSWTSSAPGVATVSTTGAVSGISGGTATITALVGTVSGASVATVAAVPFPGFTADLFLNFEECINGTAPTVGCLAPSGSGSWSTNADGGYLKATTAAQCPLSNMGDSGTLGLQYSDTLGRHGFEQWTLPTAATSLSVGFCLFTSDQRTSPYRWEEGPHVFTLFNSAFGQTWRVSDERSSADNSRQLRLSPSNSRVVVSDLTWYWVTMKYAKGGAVQMSIYQIVNGQLGTLVGSVTATDTSGTSVTDLFLGTYEGANNGLLYTYYIDNLIVDTTSAAFPLIPK